MKNLSMVLATLVAAGAMASTQQIQATVNGSPVRFADVQPMMVNQRVMVPLRGVFEHMGADIDWNEATQTVNAKMADRNVSLRIGDRYATVDGKTIEMDTPAMKYRDRTMVPLRFLGESLGAKVAWMEPNLVAITTGIAINNNEQADIGIMRTIDAMTVVPLTLNTQLSSNGSRVGDKFSGTVDTGSSSDYQGLPEGTIVEGHVNVVSPKTSKAPGVLGVEYDRVVLPNGTAYKVDASVVGLDDKSVTNENGRLVAKETQKGKDTLKWVGIGAGGGVLIAMLTKGNVITEGLIGGALGWLFSELQKRPNDSKDVLLTSGTPIGMRLDSKLVFRDSSRR